jgi:hypothetical protein
MGGVQEAADCRIRSFQLMGARPLSTSFMVMQFSTGQTRAHKLHPTHSSSMMRGTCTPKPFVFFFAKAL